MKHDLPAGWSKKLEPVWDTLFFKKLDTFLKKEQEDGKIIYPKNQNIFNALKQVDLPQVKVVIIGQDPYHGPDQAMGLSFAVPNELKKKPPSLKNIFKEVESDLGVKIPEPHSDLSGWVKQGVLLLNRVLTVENGKPYSHQGQGWEAFTDLILQTLNERKDPIVFILWGSHAQKLKSLIDLNRHWVIESAHPSPLSAYRGFFGSKVFSKVNETLKKFGKSPIAWEKT